MGRIKSLMVKRAAQKMLESQNPFTDSFEHNKKILADTMPSKSIRNKIAGYIARLKKVKKPKVKKPEELPLTENKNQEA